MSEKKVKEEPKETDTCSHCSEIAIMLVRNLKNKKEQKLCPRHFAAMVTQGQSEVMRQFAETNIGFTVVR
jgi:hypothetical protein